MMTAVQRRYRVMSTRVPGMATADSAQHQPAAAQYTEAFYGSDRVRGAGRRETAVVAQPWADNQAVAFNEYQKQCAHALRLYASESPVRRVFAGCFVN